MAKTCSFDQSDDGSDCGPVVWTCLDCHAGYCERHKCEPGKTEPSCAECEEMEAEMARREAEDDD